MLLPCGVLVTWIMHGKPCAVPMTLRVRQRGILRPLGLRRHLVPPWLRPLSVQCLSRRLRFVPQTLLQHLLFEPRRPRFRQLRSHRCLRRPSPHLHRLQLWLPRLVLLLLSWSMHAANASG